MYVFLFDFNRNCASALYHFQVTVGYISKFADFNLPHVYLAHLLKLTPFEFCQDLRRQKTRVPRLSRGVVCVILCLAVLVDRPTDGETHNDSIYHASIVSFNKKSSDII